MGQNSKYPFITMHKTFNTCDSQEECTTHMSLKEILYNLLSYPFLIQSVISVCFIVKMLENNYLSEWVDIFINIVFVNEPDVTH